MKSVEWGLDVLKNRANKLCGTIAAYHKFKDKETFYFNCSTLIKEMWEIVEELKKIEVE
ncbi:MAG: hypothetical protein ACXQTW_00310 [Candidatus Methanospirareceae archaeon]